VERLREPACNQPRGPASGLNEEEFAVKADSPRNVQAPLEIEKIDAAAQENMLAIVDGLGDLTGGLDLIRRSASAQETSRLVKVYLKSRASQSGCSREPS
jgi:hypothetical protein